MIHCFTRRRFATFFSVFALAACAEDKTAAATTAPAEQTQTARETGPALWRVSDEDSEIYLFGTFHILPASLQWSSAAFDAAMTATPFTMTEADVTSPQVQQEMIRLVQEYGLNPPGVTLSAIIGAERAAQIERIANLYDVPMTALEPLRPWLALVSLTTTAMQKSGFDPASGAESLVLARARSEGDQIDYFETAEFQIKALAGLDEEEMLGNFDATMIEFEDFDAYSNRLLNAWKTGDVATVESEIIQTLREQSPKAFEALIVSRNVAWTKRIKEILAGDKDVFIAVGAGHLVGADSVIDMLEDAGIAVERLQ